MLRRKLARIEQLPSAWEDRFADIIRTEAVAGTSRIVTQEQL